MGKDKWEYLIRYLETTNAKPESVLNLVKNTWKPKGKSKVKTDDFNITEKTLNFVDRSLTDINNSVPKEFVNDLTAVDMGKLKDKELKEVYQVSIEMKNNKKEKLTSLVKDMTEVDKKGLNLFEVSKNINDIGVKTINVQDIVKTIFPGNGQLPNKPLAVLVKGSAFQLQVWRALLDIPLGSTIAYGELAAQIDRPNAVRALGTAVGQNAISFLIPCHRVVRAGGHFGQYRWGSKRKKTILTWESLAIDRDSGF